MALVQHELKNAYIGEAPIGVGIYHNSTLGLISLSSDGTNWITISDKNLGATTVYNDGDALSQANCGKYYQWGNNYGFAWTGSISTSTSRVNASTYGPGNYYNNSTFIYTPSGRRDWANPKNDNLWGNTTDTLEARRGPCDEGFHIPKTDEWQSIKTIMDGLLLTTGTDWNKYLLLPKAGQRNYTNANASGQGDVCHYFCSGPYGDDLCDMLNIQPSSAYVSGQYDARSTGLPIRAIKNTPTTPDASWTVMYQPN